MNCPTCDGKFEGFADASDRDLDETEPEEGMLGVCSYCAELVEFTASGLVALDADRLNGLDPSSRASLLEVQRSIKAFYASSKKAPRA